MHKICTFTNFKKYEKIFNNFFCYFNFNVNLNYKLIKKSIFFLTVASTFIYFLLME